MARVNARAKSTPKFTHEGAPASLHVNPEQQLRRLVMACLLWEDQFYVDGVTIAEQIETAANAVHPTQLAKIAIEARNVAQLRHVPLLLADIMTKRSADMAGAVAQLLQRADEPAELIALNLKRRGLLNVNKAKTIPASIRKGIELALQTGKNFGAYGLAKYDRKDAEVKLRDVFRLVRPTPLNGDQAAMWRAAVAGMLPIPDTWETALSAGEDKRETFERMLREGTIGYLALLRNLRKMLEVGVPQDLIEGAIIARKGSARVLPFRYIAAARAAPRLEAAIDQALVASIDEAVPLKGTTAILVDVSGSMDARLSSKSELTRADAAAALASVINADRLRVFSFSTFTREVPARRGMAGVDAILKSQPHRGTYLGEALRWVNDLPDIDRIIVITDEQSQDRVPAPVATRQAYMINVASYQNGVSYDTHWARIDGFSENVIRFIREYEASV